MKVPTYLISYSYHGRTEQGLGSIDQVQPKTDDGEPDILRSSHMEMIRRAVRQELTEWSEVTIQGAYRYEEDEEQI